MSENPDNSLLSSSSTTPTPSLKHVEKGSPASEETSTLLDTIILSTTPSTSPSISPRLRPSTSERDTKTMSSYSSQYPPESGSKKHSSKSKSKSKVKNDDWTDVTEPEERRRIQNRIAQRKFREKQKEHKERAERDERNQENAGSSYRVPDAAQLGPDDEELSGLPWGGVSMRHVMARGHESETRRGSGRDDYTHDNAQYYNTYSGYYTSSSQHQQTASWGSRGSSGGDDQQQDDQQYYCDYEYDYDQGHDQNSGGGPSYRT